MSERLTAEREAQIRDSEGYWEASAYVGELLAELDAVRAELSAARQAIGLATTCVPDMEMDATHPIEMMQEVCQTMDGVRADLATSEADYRAATVTLARAEATLAALRAWADNHTGDEFVYYAQAVQDVTVLLDAKS